MSYPVTFVARSSISGRVIAPVVGSLCMPLDLLADRMAPSMAEVDDMVVIFQSSAYGATANPQAFLGHPLVAEVLV